MLEYIGLTVIALLIAYWWITASPRSEIRCCVADSITFDLNTLDATDKVGRSADFARDLEVLTSPLPAYDDAIFVDNGATAWPTSLRQPGSQ